MSRVVVFTDIDDTLVHTAGKLSQPSTDVGALDKQGNPLSFFTQGQRQLLELMLAGNAIIIPVTGRNKDALDRVLVDFHDYKVVSHGAVVLEPGGGLCDQWLSSIDEELGVWPDELERANQRVLQAIKSLGLDARSRVIIDQGISAYVSIKGDLESLAKLKQVTSDELSVFFRHENGRNHALLPPYTRKKRAIEHVAGQLGLSQQDLTIGIGDSLSDLPFMTACQFLMVPNNSQITKAFFD